MKNIISYRDTTLETSDFEKLDAIAQNVITFGTRTTYDIIRDKDEYGDMVERRIERSSELNLKRNGVIAPRLLESLLRPCLDTAIGRHLLRLTAHKPWTRGAELWRIVVDDLCRDLSGVSEYAIMKICDNFRRQDNLEYFPDTATLIGHILALDAELKALAFPPRRAPSSPPQFKPEEQLPPRTFKSQRRVALVVKLGLRDPASITRWQRLWLEIFKNKAKA